MELNSEIFRYSVCVCCGEMGLVGAGEHARLFECGFVAGRKDYIVYLG